MGIGARCARRHLVEVQRGTLSLQPVALPHLGLASAPSLRASWHSSSACLVRASRAVRAALEDRLQEIYDSARAQLEAFHFEEAETKPAKQRRRCD